MLLLGICDDLQSDRNHIEKLINDYCMKESHDIEIMTFENGEALVNYYIDGRTSFDIIFLDIYMGGRNGIQTAEQIRKYDSDCRIIFTTTSTSHALESFEVFPFNYLVKPISETVFSPILGKALKEINKEKKKSLSVKIGPGIQTVFYKDILFIESEAKVIKIHTVNDKTFAFYTKLDDIEKQINDRRFLRCHKSFLVNMDYILSVEEYFLKLTCNTQISVTQRYFAAVKKIFYAYLLEKANLK